MAGYYASANMPPELHAQSMRTGRMPIPSQNQTTSAHSTHQSKTGLINYAQHPNDPHPSAVISAAPQVFFSMSIIFFHSEFGIEMSENNRNALNVYFH